jgi:hypothetical protein
MFYLLLTSVFADYEYEEVLKGIPNFQLSYDICIYCSSTQQGA